MTSPHPERRDDCVTLVISADFKLEAELVEETEAVRESDGAKEAVALLASGIAGWNTENRLFSLLLELEYIYQHANDAMSATAASIGTVWRIPGDLS